MTSVAKNICHEVNSEWTVWKNVTSVAELNVHSSNDQMVDLLRLILCVMCLLSFARLEEERLWTLSPELLQ
jgi:hypothetical protein